MTAPQPGNPHHLMDRPACTPAAIRAVLAANAYPEILRRYDRELDAAFDDLTTLVQTVRRWWFEADAWRDPEAQPQFLARMDRYQSDGPPARASAHHPRGDPRPVRRLTFVPLRRRRHRRPAARQPA
jgi:hypothetical protein